MLYDVVQVVSLCSLTSLVKKVRCRTPAALLASKAEENLTSERTEKSKVGKGPGKSEEYILAWHERGVLIATAAN